MKDIRDYKPVRDFLLDISIYDDLEKVAETHGVPLERVDEFLQLTDAVVKGKAEMSQMPALFEKAFGLDVEKSRKLAADVSGYALLPLEHYLPGVVDKISEWGGVIGEYPTKRVGKEKASPDRFVQDLAVKLELELPENLMQRFEYLAKGYLTKTRAKEATKKILMRRLNLGGLEFTEPMVENLFKTLDAEAKNFDIGEEEVVALPEKAKEIASSQSPRNDKDVKPRVTSKVKKTVPDHAQVIRQKRMMSKKAFMDALSKYTIEKPKKVVQAAKVAMKEMRDESAGKKHAETNVNKTLAPIVTMFRDKGLSSVAFRDVVTGYLKDERNAEETRAHLNAVGQFSEQEADQLLNSLEAARRYSLSHKVSSGESADTQVKIISKPTPIEKVDRVDFSSSVPVERITSALTTSVPIISGLDLHEDEIAELEHHRKEMQKRGTDSSTKLSEKTQKKVNDALKPLAKIFKKKRVAKKAFQDVSSAHVRGIREKKSSRSMLKDKYKITGKDLDVAMKSLESARKIAQGAGNLKSSSAPKKKANIRAKDKDVLNRRHAAVTGKVSDQDIEPILPNAKVSAARSKEEELALQKGEVSQEQMKKAQAASRPKKANAKVSSATVQGKKRVTDVTVARRLVGPVEELGTMIPAEFRRLSSDPKEAALKVLDKLELLESTSYEERIKGVRAWRKSPINALYRQMANEALKKGKSIAEIATEWRNVGRESLSPSEIQAIVDLNRKIKF